jgi:hypothetical protein
MRSVEAATDIMYPVSVNTSEESIIDGYGEDSTVYSDDVGVAHEDHELGPEIHLTGWTGSRGHVSDSDCDDIDYNRHEAQWVFFGNDNE